MGADIRRDGRVTCALRRSCEFAGSGDTHNDLRSAASLLSGDLVLWLGALHPNRLFQTHAEGEPVLDFQAQHRSVPQAVELREKLNGLGLQGEVFDRHLSPRAVFSAQLDFTNHFRGRM